MNDTEAVMDQWQAQQRDYAEWCARIFVTYRDAGFTRKECMEMLHRYLDFLEHHALH